MTIDLKTGEIAIQGTRIGPATGEDVFLTSVAGKGVTQVRQTATRNSYEIWLPDDASGQQIGAVFSFLPGGSLEQARFKFVKPDIRAVGSSRWSKEVEDEIKSFYDNWLHKQIGEPPPYRFSWGRIRSIID